jgi:hypothetical protein
MARTLRHGVKRARSLARRVSGDWARREAFAQDGLLAGRTITPPGPRAVQRDLRAASRDSGQRAHAAERRECA